MNGEFDLIAQHFVRPLRHTLLGPGDDCALVTVPPGQTLALSADMLVEGRHFVAGADPYRLGQKSLAVNLSDLAAMGATPRWMMLSIALPHNDAEWLAEFSRGLFAEAAAFDVDLIGGDTTRGPLTISLQIMGLVPPGTALQRSGAKAGDDVWISGFPGEAGAGLLHQQGRLALPEAAARCCLERLDSPTPRVALGHALRGVATAALDVSDGLAQDLGHLADCSGLQAVVYPHRLPPPRWAAEMDEIVWRQIQLTGGDDYELCFSAPPEKRAVVSALAARLDLPLTRIGRLQAGQGVRLEDVQGHRLDWPLRGFDHFA